VIAHTHSIDPPATASSSAGGFTPSGSISSVSAGAFSGNTSSNGGFTPSGSISSTGAHSHGGTTGATVWTGGGVNLDFMSAQTGQGVQWSNAMPTAGTRYMPGSITNIYMASSSHSHNIGSDGTHNHSFSGNYAGDHSHTTDIGSFTSGSTGAASGITAADGTGATSGASAYLHTHSFTPAGTVSAPTFTGSAGTTGSDGTGATGINNPPFLVVNFIIKY